MDNNRLGGALGGYGYLDDAGTGKKGCGCFRVNRKHMLTSTDRARYLKKKVEREDGVESNTELMSHSSWLLGSSARSWRV